MTKINKINHLRKEILTYDIFNIQRSKLEDILALLLERQDYEEYGNYNDCLMDECISPDEMLSGYEISYDYCQMWMKGVEKMGNVKTADGGYLSTL